METVDFSRSFLTFRTDWQKKPSQTASHKPPFTLNNARILLNFAHQQILLIPEPSGLVLLSIGLAALVGGYFWRRMAG